MYWSKGMAGLVSVRPSSKNSKRRKPLPRGVGSSEMLPAFFILRPALAVVENVTRRPVAASFLPRRSMGLMWPWPGKLTRKT